MKTYLSVYLGAGLLALVITPLVIHLGKRLRLVDRPGARKVHAGPVPRLGGLAIMLASVAMTLCIFALDNRIGQEFRQRQTQLLALLGGALFMFLVGFIDDIHHLRARVKLVAQLAAAVTVALLGIRIRGFAVGGWSPVPLGPLAVPVTVLWIVGVTNAVNFIDGLDGLAAGISAITCGVIAVFAIYSGQPVMAVLMLAMLGSLTTFLLFNFNPARIFMGDGGSYFLGFMLAAGSVMCNTKSAALVALALPAIALGLPIFDTLFSMLRRVMERRSLDAPDRNHIHHRLLSMGIHHRHVVIIMYVVTLLAAGLGMFMMVTRDVGTLLVLGCVLLLLVMVFRAVGSVRLRETIAALRRNLAIARDAKEARHEFEGAELLLREAGSFDTWWQAVCAAADQLELARLSLPLTNRDGAMRTLIWRRSGPAPGPHETVRMSVPVRDRRTGPPLRAELDVLLNGSLEAAGRRGTLFARLIDEHSLASLPPSGAGE